MSSAWSAMSVQTPVIVDPSVDFAARAREMILACGYDEARPEHLQALAAFLVRLHAHRRALGLSNEPS